MTLGQTIWSYLQIVNSTFFGCGIDVSLGRLSAGRAAAAELALASEPIALIDETAELVLVVEKLALSDGPAPDLAARCHASDVARAVSGYFRGFLGAAHPSFCIKTD